MGVDRADESEIISISDETDVQIVDDGTKVAIGAFLDEVVDVDVEQERREDASLFDARVDVKGGTSLSIDFDVSACSSIVRAEKMPD